MKKHISALAAVAVLALALTSCSTDETADPGGEGTATPPPLTDVTLTWETTGGQTTERAKEVFQEPFSEVSGVKFENVSSPSAINQIRTMVETGNVLWDITHKGSYVGLQHCGTLFEEVDYASLPVDLFPEGSTSACARPLAKYGTAFVYDHEVYTGTVPTKIEDFFDAETFPGKRAIYGANARGVLEAALVADGVAPADLYPLDIERGIAKLDTIKEHFIFAPTLPALQQNLLDKQATMAIALTGGLASTFERGATITPVWDFTTWDFDALLIPKGSKNVEAAKQAIEFALQPEQVVRYAEAGGQAPARNDIDVSSIEYADWQSAFSPFVNADKGDLVLLDPQWWADNVGAATEAYVGWQVG